MPDLSHLWQRFLLASSLIVGVAIGAAVTIFGYSNLGTVNVRWSVFHIDGVPLWTVAIVPLALFLIAGTLYHWMDGLHHFTEHMRHRRLVHDLEAEVASLRSHLDQVLDMPDHSTSRLPATATVAEPPAAEGIAEVEPAEIASLPEPAAAEASAANGSANVAQRKSRKRANGSTAEKADKEEPTEAASSPEAEA